MEEGRMEKALSFILNYLRQGPMGWRGLKVTNKSADGSKSTVGIVLFVCFLACNSQNFSPNMGETKKALSLVSSYLNTTDESDKAGWRIVRSVVPNSNFYKF